MKKYIFGLLFVCVFACCGTSKNTYHSKIYDKIYKCQGIDINNIKQPYDVRIQMDNVNKLIQWDYLDKLGYSKENDTIYALEMDGIQGDFLFTVWNKDHTLSYTNVSGKLMLTERCLFTKHMMKLVSEWNIDEIRKEEKINKVSLPEETIFATRIIFNKGKYSIDCLTFNDFFNLNDYGSKSGNVSAEGRATDGIVQINTTYEQDTKVQGYASKTANSGKAYNASSFNCSTFAESALKTVFPKLNASQYVKVPFPLNAIYNNTRVVAPNNLYNATMKLPNTTNIRGPKSVVAKPYLEYYGK